MILGLTREEEDHETCGIAEWTLSSPVKHQDIQEVFHHARTRQSCRPIHEDLSRTLHYRLRLWLLVSLHHGRLDPLIAGATLVILVVHAVPDPDACYLLIVLIGPQLILG